jgi:hypothetical protein
MCLSNETQISNSKHKHKQTLCCLSFCAYYILPGAYLCRWEFVRAQNLGEPAVAEAISLLFDADMDVQLPSDSQARLGKVLGKDKTTFLDDLERLIFSHIVGTGRQCIAIVQKIPKKGTAEADDHPAFRYYLYKCELNKDDLGDFVKVLFKFMMRKKHEGYDLDSALTVPILEIVEQRFVALYEAHGQAISEELLLALRKDEVLLESFVGRLSDAVSSKMSKKAQKEIVNILAHQTHDAVTSSTAHFSTTAVGSQVTLMAAKVLARTLAANIGHVLAKVMASAAFKKVLHALIHKMVVGVIVGAVLKFLAATFGASVLPFAFPIMATAIYAQAKGFPSKLGREVSKSVRDHLGLQFEGMNREILKDTYQKIFQGKDLLEVVAANKDVKEMCFAVAKQFS